MEVPETQPNPYLCTSACDSSTECERKHDNCVGARHACAFIEDFLEFLDSIPSPKVPVKLSAEVQERISREVEEEMKMLFEEFEENVAIPNLGICQIGNKMGDENFPPIILRNGGKGSERETPEKEEAMVVCSTSSPQSPKQVPLRPLGPDGIPRGVHSNPPNTLQDPTQTSQYCPSGGLSGTAGAPDPGPRTRTPHGSRGMSGIVTQVKALWKRSGINGTPKATRFAKGPGYRSAFGMVRGWTRPPLQPPLQPQLK